MTRYQNIARALARAIAIAACLTALTACGTSPATGAPTPSAGSVTATSGTIGVSGTASASPGQLVTIPTTGATTPGPRRIHAGRSGLVRLTESDNGATVILRPGQLVIVVLGGRGLISWRRPIVTSQGAAAVRRTSASGGYPTRHRARARFLALRRGTATLTSITDAACLHAQPPCEIAQRIWTVTVIVK